MTGDINPIDPVLPEHACPRCGQCEADELVWVDDDQVQCQRCKTVYQPAEMDATLN